jgi:pimeloyl-ACP methyl ester carboxylesterase
MKRILAAIQLASSLVVPAIAAATDSSFDSNGVRIRYKVVGRGEPIVLVHGWAASAEMWDPVSEDLSRNYQVIALDCRGHGQSGKPHEPKQYGLEMVNDVVRLLDHLHLQKAHVMGYSMGGGIVLKMLVEHPERFLTAIVGGSEGFRRGSDPDWNDEKLIKDLESGMPMSDAMIKNAPAEWPTPSPEQREMMKRMDAGQDPKALAAQRRGNVGLQIDYVSLKRIRVPVLVLCGGRDNPDRVKPLVAALPDARLDVIEGAGHGSAPASPQFTKDVREFLEQHPARRKPAA